MKSGGEGRARGAEIWGKARSPGWNAFSLRVDFAKLAEFDTWARAFNQIFFSLSVALGALVTFGSYRPKSEDYVRDGVLVPVINCATSFTAGFFVFAMLGYISEQKGVEIRELEFSGFALAFIT